MIDVVEMHFDWDRSHAVMLHWTAGNTKKKNNIFINIAIARQSEIKEIISKICPKYDVVETYILHL